MTRWQLDIPTGGTPQLVSAPSQRDRVTLSGRAYLALVGRRHPRVARMHAAYRRRGRWSR